MKYDETLVHLQRQAEKEKLVLSVAGGNELFIDLDDTDDLRPVVQALKKISAYLGGVYKAWYRRSKGRQGFHVRVQFTFELDPRERVALHLLTGSDPTRELLRLKAIRYETTDTDSVFLDRAEFPERELKWNKTCNDSIA